MCKMKLIVRDFEDYCEQFPLWSTIYLQMGEWCYPCDNWTDSTSAILEMWINSVIMMMGAINSVTLYFMDGAYAVKLVKQSTSVAEASFLNSNGEVLCTESIDLFYFIRQLLAAVGRMSYHYRDHRDAPQIQCVLRAAEHLRNTIHVDQ